MLNQHGKNRISASITLAAFLTASIIIHISLFFTNLTRPEIKLGSATTNTISVHINQNTKQESHQNQSQYTHSAKPKTLTASGQTAPKTELAHNDKQQQSHTLSNLRQMKIIGQLKQELARFFYYPPQAQRRGIQGQVIIGFKLNQHGKINSVSISKSSGYAVLDNAALDAFSQASQFFSTSLLNNPVYINIPIKFQLSGG